MSDEVCMSRKRFARLWFGLFWSGVLAGYIIGAATTAVLR